MKLLSLILVLAAAPTWAQDKTLEAAIDGIVAAQFSEHPLIGVTVSIVQNDQILLAKGYGYADRETARPVDATKTLFRVGSISKVLVWLAVLQQVELGQLTLDEDVNSYLGNLHIPEFAGRPLTLRHIMTHTSGFEDWFFGLYARGPRTLGTLVENQKKYLPERVEVPGIHTAYSNYATGLAARMVEIASGLSWDAYVQQNIFEPLRLENISTRQPLPANLIENMATGYLGSEDNLKPIAFEFVSIAPPGSVSASAAAIAGLMNSLLAVDRADIITSQSKRMLLSRTHGDQRLNGVTLGMYERTLSGERAVGHGGALNTFFSQMVLWPGQNLGVFVSYNASSASNLSSEFIEAFMRYSGLDGTPALVAAVTDRERYYGVYTTMRRPQSSSARLYTLMNVARVEPFGDNYLQITTPGQSRVFGALSDGTLGQRDGHEKVLISNGKLNFHSVPVVTYERLPTWLLPEVQGGLVALVVLLNILVLLVWPWSSVHHKGDKIPKGQLLATLVTLSAAIVIGYFLILLAGSVSNPMPMLYGESASGNPMLWLPVALTALVVIQLYCTYQCWVRGYWWLTRRFHLTFLLLANSGFVFFCFYWRLLPPEVFALL